MFLSSHINEMKDMKINVDLIDDSSLAGISEFAKHHIVLEIKGKEQGNVVIYMRESEALDLVDKLYDKLIEQRGNKIKKIDDQLNELKKVEIENLDRWSKGNI